MKTSFNQETGTKTWLMDKWYQKSAYVLGTILFWFYMLCIIIGVISAMNE